MHEHALEGWHFFTMAGSPKKIVSELCLEEAQDEHVAGYAALSKRK